MVSCVFLSHKKTSSKQNLKLIFILQPLLAGSEINTTLKETLINITELKLKHNNWGNFLTVFLTGSLTTFTMIWRLILKKIVVALTAKVLKEKTKTKNKKTKLEKNWCSFLYEWNLLTRRKGEENWSSMFLLNFFQATKGGMNLFFPFIFWLYLSRVKLKKKLVPFRLSNLKLKMQFFDHTDVIVLF